MSQFLAPIHQWLFDKIRIMESIEKAIIQTEYSGEEQSAVMADLSEKAGNYLADAPLADLIDPGNIHGWLQDTISVVETRQSFLIRKLLSEDTEALDRIKKVYGNFGEQKGKEISSEKPEDADSLFQVLNNYLLEGMPCDRVNVVTEKELDKLAWRTERCVHAGNWEKGGTDVEVYYELRASFTKEFIKAANPAFDYNFQLTDGVQQHIILKGEN